MGIDNRFWWPAGSNRGWEIAPWEDPPEDNEIAAAVHFSHGRNYSIDNMYYFESVATAALWFWRSGWERYQLVDDGIPVGYDHMALWIGDHLVDQRPPELIERDKRNHA